MNDHNSSSSKRRIFTLLKVIAFGVLIYFLYHFLFDEIDFKLVLSHIKEANLFYLFLGFFFLFFKYVIFGLKFNLSSYFFDVKVKTQKYLLNEFKLLFMEFLFPVPNAEDFFRVLFHKLKNIELHKCISIIMVMRISSIVSIVFLLAGLLTELGSLFMESKIWLAVILFCLLLVFILSYKIWIRILLKFIKKPKWLVKLLTDINDNSINTKQYAALTTVSFIHYLFAALAIYFILLSIGTQLSMYKIMIILPAMIFSFILPLSIQGYGLPEAALLFLLVQFGIPEESATAATLLHLFFYTLLIIIGALLFLFDKDYDLKVIRDQINLSRKKFLTNEG